MTTQELVVRGQAQTKLSPFGSRAELREMADRIQRTISVTQNRETRRMTLPEAMYLASVSLATGLNPWAGEVYPLVDKEGRFSAAPGRNGWTKAAAQQMQAEGGGNYWPEYHPLTDEEQRNLYLVPKGAVAFICRLYDTQSVREYSQAVERLSKAGAPWREIVNILGEKPYTLGVGWHVPQEEWREKNYPPVQRAQKRALCDALRKRFHLPFDMPESADELPEEFTGKFTDSEPESTVVDNK